MRYKLVCFDIDGTLIDNVEFSWELFHEHFRTDRKKRDDARSDYYHGKISYEEWALHDIGLWRSAGATKKTLQEAISELKLMKGALETITSLKEKGLKLAVISGSISIIPDTIIPNFRENFKDIFINELAFGIGGEITGIKITEFDIDGKADALKNIAERENIPLSETVFIGDHRNDLKVIKLAGLGIAFDPKSPEIIDAADVVIREKDLRLVLPHILK